MRLPEPARRVLARSSVALALVAALPSCMGICGAGDQAVFAARFEMDTPGQAPLLTRQFGSMGAKLEVEGKIQVVQPPQLAGRKGLQLQRNTILPETRLLATASSPIFQGVAYVTWKGFAADVPLEASSAMTLRILSSTGAPVATFMLVGGRYEVIDGNGSVQQLVGQYDPRKDHNMVVRLFPLQRKFNVCVNGKLLAKDLPFESPQAVDVHAVEAKLPMAVLQNFPADFVVDLLRITK